MTLFWCPAEADVDCIKTVCEAAVTVQRLPFSDRLWVLEFAANPITFPSERFKYLAPETDMTDWTVFLHIPPLVVLTSVLKMLPIKYMESNRNTNIGDKPSFTISRQLRRIYSGMTVGILFSKEWLLLTTTKPTKILI